MVVDTEMTIFYYKSNGDIYRVSSGNQPIDVYFTDHAADMMLMLSSIVLPYDINVQNNQTLFKIDIAKSPVILTIRPVITETSTYPVATS